MEIYPCVIKTEEEEEVYCLLDIVKRKLDQQSSNSQKYKLDLPRRKILNKTKFKSEYFSDDDSL